jgi:hypothetical protein
VVIADANHSRAALCCSRKMLPMLSLKQTLNQINRDGHHRS